MEKLFDETYAAEDNSVVSRNIWYGYVELYADGEYGKQIVLDDKIKELICGIIKNDISENISPSPTEINWYMYGKTVTTDAIDDSVRPTIMVRYKGDGFLVRCNMSDHDFAMNIDFVLSFEKDLEKTLGE